MAGTLLEILNITDNDPNPLQTKVANNMRKTIHKSDKKFFGSDKRKAKSYSLIYMVGGSEEVIMAEKPYAMCKWKKQEIRHWIQYRSGNLNIVPNY